MARIVTRPEDWVWYVPNIEDNRIDPEPVQVEIHPLSTEELRAYQRGLLSGKGLKNPGLRAQHVVGRIFKERVRAVKNYVIDGKAITSGEELFARGEVAFIDDVYEALTELSVLNEGLLGKLNSRSGSISPATAKPHAGAAAAASAPMNPGSLNSATRNGEASATAIERATQASGGHGLPGSLDAHGVS